MNVTFPKITLYDKFGFITTGDLPSVKSSLYINELSYLFYKNL